MGLKSALSKPFAAVVNWQLNKLRKNAVALQQKTFQQLIAQAKNTAFGTDHGFGKINTYADFKKHVPVYDYEDLRPYINRIVNGEPNVLWPGKPAYLAKTSGTTSGVKYIPISKESMPQHIKSRTQCLVKLCL